MARLERHPDRADQRTGFARHGRARPPGKFAYVYQGHIEKIPILEEILREVAASRQRRSPTSATISPTRRHAARGLGDRHGECAAGGEGRAHYVTEAGRTGAVREVAELLLKAQGYWERHSGSTKLADPATLS